MKSIETLANLLKRILIFGLIAEILGKVLL